MLESAALQPPSDARLKGGQDLKREAFPLKKEESNEETQGGRHAAHWRQVTGVRKQSGERERRVLPPPRGLRTRTGTRTAHGDGLWGRDDAVVLAQALVRRACLPGSGNKDHSCHSKGMVSPMPKTTGGSKADLVKDAAGRDGAACPDRRVVRNVGIPESEGRPAGLPSFAPFSSTLTSPCWQPVSPRPNTIRQTPWKELPSPGCGSKHSRQHGHRHLLAGHWIIQGQPRSPRVKERSSPCAFTPKQGSGPCQRTQTLNHGSLPLGFSRTVRDTSSPKRHRPAGRQPPGTPCYELRGKKRIKQDI